MTNTSSPTNSIERLLEIMRKLRDPESGCPWDIKQNFQSIVPYTLEETYEVIDAIEREDYQELKSELGDLLFQVVFYAQLGKEQGSFDFYSITQAISDKLTRRHPHVFGDATFDTDEELHTAWEKQKLEERQEKDDSASILDDIPKALPAITRAQKMQKRAAKNGFDWDNIEHVWDKVSEEKAELKEAIKLDKYNHEDIENELGDLLFSVINLSRHLKVDSERALRRATDKFERRFRMLEAEVVDSGKSIDSCSLEELDKLWEVSKSSENK